MNEPRVFAPGALTLAITREGVAAACGHVNVGFIRTLTVNYESEKGVTVAVEFFRSHHPETSRQIEEAVRVARSLGWLDVAY